MALPTAFLDQLRDRTPMSALVGRAVKLVKAGREHKGCCPFHGEKTPSFTVNDEKQFAHCFGCGWHGDAFRWLTDHDGLTFIEAVRQLAETAGIEMPERSPEAAERAKRSATVREALDAAQAVYVRQLGETGAVAEYLSGRGIGPDEIAAFGLGYARGGAGSLAGQGIGAKLGVEAGLLAERADGRGLREMFWDRITIPIHDARGRLCGFGGRVWPGRKAVTGQEPPKFVNSPEGPLFDKGRLLFNLHRAAPLARPAAENRLLVVEGYFDVVALHRAGIGAAVAPLGTALTADQLALAWRWHNRPVLVLDGDKAGRAAALRAARTALPLLGPGRSLAVALLPEGQDPDDLVQALGPEAARRAIEALVLEALPLHTFLFEAVRDGLGDDPAPEARAACWEHLAELGRAIGDEETRAQYLGTWRARFDREVSAVPALAEGQALHSFTRSEDGEYVFPDSEGDSAARLIMIVRAALRLREQRREITADLNDLMKMAEGIGFVKREINAVIRDIESDLAYGPVSREESEMLRVLYRRTLGVRGPMDEAMLPRATEARARPATAAIKRRATMHALIDASGASV